MISPVQATIAKIPQHPTLQVTAMNRLEAKDKQWGRDHSKENRIFLNGEFVTSADFLSHVNLGKIKEPIILEHDGKHYVKHDPEALTRNFSFLGGGPYEAKEIPTIQAFAAIATCRQFNPVALHVYDHDRDRAPFTTGLGIKLFNPYGHPLKLEGLTSELEEWKPLTIKPHSHLDLAVDSVLLRQADNPGEIEYVGLDAEAATLGTRSWAIKELRANPADHAENALPITLYLGLLRGLESERTGADANYAAAA